MLAQDLSELLGSEVETLGHRPLGGGCISEVTAVTLRSDADLPESLVVKRNRASMVSNFRCEADGLRAIAKSKTIRVPEVYACGVVGESAYLLIEQIDSGRRHNFARFGARLAEFHRATLGSEIGWHEDNFLGSADQRNESLPSWAEFVAERRIGFQLRWAIEQGLADSELKGLGERVIRDLPELLRGRVDETSLLHGDLWSGNYLFDGSGEPALLDPAVYRGCREAEFGMLHLFGSCGAEFYEAYQDTWPMPDGWQRRADVYVLYHLLNHLNLFGSSYLSGSKSKAREILRQGG